MPRSCSPTPALGKERTLNSQTQPTILLIVIWTPALVSAFVEYLRAKIQESFPQAVSLIQSPPPWIRNQGHHHPSRKKPRAYCIASSPSNPANRAFQRIANFPDNRRQLQALPAGGPGAWDEKHRAKRRGHHQASKRAPPLAREMKGERPDGAAAARHDRGPGQRGRPTAPDGTRLRRDPPAP